MRPTRVCQNSTEVLQDLSTGTRIAQLPNTRLRDRVTGTSTARPLTLSHGELLAQHPTVEDLQGLPNRGVTATER